MSGTKCLFAVTLGVLLLGLVGAPARAQEEDPEPKEIERLDAWPKLSKDEKLLIEKLAEVQGEPPSPGKGLFERIRDSFR